MKSYYLKTLSPRSSLGIGKKNPVFEVDRFSLFKNLFICSVFKWPLKKVRWGKVVIERCLGQLNAGSE